MRVLFLSLILSTFVDWSAAAADNDAVYVRGVGTATCAQFAEMYRKAPETTELTFITWAQGMMSGINLSVKSPEKPHNLDSINIEDQKAALREYCDSHPLKLYVSGVIDLYKGLKEAPLPPSQQ